MSTRSTLTIKDLNGDVMASLYIHYDGYPEGWPTQAKKFLEGGELVNGITTQAEFGKVFNGFRDMAAQLIVHLKGNEVGNVYLAAPDNTEEYNYVLQETKSGYKLYETHYDLKISDFPKTTPNFANGKIEEWTYDEEYKILEGKVIDNPNFFHNEDIYITNVTIEGDEATGYVAVTQFIKYRLGARK